MNLFVIIFLTYCFLHFIYESTILPSIRMELRNKLFSLRDELRDLKIEGKMDGATQSDFDILHGGINHYLNRLSLVTVSYRYAIMKEIESDPKIRESAKARMSRLETCGREDVLKIYSEMNRTLSAAFVFNSLGWAFYIIPAILLWKSITKPLGFIKASLFLPNRVIDSAFGKQ